MNPSNSLINGLKSNVARGFGLAEFWEATYKKTVPNLLKSWKMLEGCDGVDVRWDVGDMAWETVNAYTHYQTVDSKDIGIFSTIEMMTIPAKTYTTKNGVIKTTPEEKVPSHYTRNGDFLGRVSALGNQPISYKVRLHITNRHFEFAGVGNTLESCFKLREEFDEGEFKMKDIPKSERKAEKAKPIIKKKIVLVDDDNSDSEDDE